METKRKYEIGEIIVVHDTSLDSYSDTRRDDILLGKVLFFTKESANCYSYFCELIKFEEVGFPPSRVHDFKAWGVERSRNETLKEIKDDDLCFSFLDTDKNIKVLLDEEADNYYSKVIADKLKEEFDQSYWLNGSGLREWHRKDAPHLKARRAYHWTDRVIFLDTTNSSGGKVTGECLFSQFDQTSWIPIENT